MRIARSLTAKVSHYASRAAEIARMQAALVKLVRKTPPDLLPGMRKLLSDEHTMTFLSRFGNVPTYASTGERFAKYSHTFGRYITAINHVFFYLECLTNNNRPIPKEEALSRASFFAREAKEGFLHIAKILRSSLIGLRESKPKEFDVAAEVVEHINSFSSEHKFHQITIEHDLPFGLRGFMDQYKFRDVLISVFLNASDAMGGGYSAREDHRFRIAHRKTSIREKPFIALTFTDTGEGFNQQEAQRFFEPFSSTKTKWAHGAGEKAIRGLGLFVSQQMMREAGGDYLLESPGKGKGATVTLLIPAARAQESQIPLAV